MHIPAHNPNLFASESIQHYIVPYMYIRVAKLQIFGVQIVSRQTDALMKRKNCDTVNIEADFKPWST
jgi:hypothetical protein